MIKGFSKLTKNEKIKQVQIYLNDSELVNDFYLSALENKNLEKIISELSENVLSVHPFPYSLVPNFLIDGHSYFVPMVTEESSVVAAAAKSAGFWSERGGFHTEIIGVIKTGQVHFKFTGSSEQLNLFFEQIKPVLYKAVSGIDARMKIRGGGIQDISLINRTKDLEFYYQLHIEFDTCDAMGANYMNSCLETIAHEFRHLAQSSVTGLNGRLEIIMAILSNYSPESAVKVWGECIVPELDDGKLEISAQLFAEKFRDAVRIAEIDIHRAVTHNKGFYNGIDAVALATGNDWRAIESNGHAFAASTGKYKSISTVRLNGNVFRFEATVPLQVGTVGGITNLHPLAKMSLKILKNPSAKDLMRIMASAGLASNFAAVRSLITTGIQKGHMKMHLTNMLMMMHASENERTEANKHFEHFEISYAALEDFIQKLRGN